MVPVLNGSNDTQKKLDEKAAKNINFMQIVLKLAERWFIIQPFKIRK